jgi:hypothetical protein
MSIAQKIVDILLESDRPNRDPNRLPRPSNTRYDWTGIDWEKSNHQIAKEMGCSSGSALSARLKYAPYHLKISPRDRVQHHEQIYDWSQVDWEKSDSQIARETGASVMTVLRARRKHAPEHLKRSLYGARGKRLAPPGS